MSMRMWTTRRHWLFAGAAVAILLAGVPVLAASDAFKQKAQEFYDRHCTRGRTTDIIATLCYLFDKTGELGSALNQLAERVQGLEANQGDLNEKLAIHEARLQVLEAAQHTHVPSPSPPAPPTFLPGLIIFAFNRAASFTTEGVKMPVSETFGGGYKSMTFHVMSTGSIQNYSILVDFGQGDFEEHRLTCGGSSKCPEITLPIFAAFSDAVYRLSLGTSSGLVTSVASLNYEANSQAVLVGQDVALPFTSADLPTGGYRTILFTVGQRDPQNINSISLQRFDGSQWVESGRVVCDGGAVCPLSTLGVVPSQRHRVVVEGSGAHALIGALIRP